MIFIYSNDTQQIRNGLVNYIGSLLNASPFKGKAAKQHVIGSVVEEALKMAINEDGTVDMYSAKPFFRASKIIFEKRISELQNLPSTGAVKSQLVDYKHTINMLNNLIDNIKE